MEGADTLLERWIFAVAGGGPSEVRPAGCLDFEVFGPIKELVLGRASLRGLAGVTPPYFSSNCCVELYFVAALSLSMVAERCVVRWSR